MALESPTQAHLMCVSPGRLRPEALRQPGSNEGTEGEAKGKPPGMRCPDRCDSVIGGSGPSIVVDTAHRSEESERRPQSQLSRHPSDYRPEAQGRVRCALHSADL